KSKACQETRTFGAMTGELLELADWLAQEGVTHVAMESTGVYWKPVWNLLEDQFTVLLVNAQHIKQVPGRKTDVKDSEWIAQLLQHGLLRGSFVPSTPQRQLRELTASATAIDPDEGVGSEPHSEGARGCQHQVGIGGVGCLGGVRAGHVARVDRGRGGCGGAGRSGAED